MKIENTGFEPEFNDEKSQQMPGNGSTNDSVIQFRSTYTSKRYKEKKTGKKQPVKKQDASKGYIAFVPENLNLDEILAEHPYNHKRKLKKDKMLFLISTIRVLSAQKEHLLTKEGYVPLSSTYLKNTLGDYYKPYLEYLINVGIILCDGIFIIGEKSKGYKLSPQYDEAGITEVKLTDKPLLKQLQKDSPETIEAKEAYPHLYKWLNGLQVDEIGFEKALSRKRSAKSIKKANRDRLAMRRVANRDFYFSLGEKARRLFTNVVGMKSEYRKYLSYNGQPLTSIDIKSSQPYLSVKDLLEKYNLQVIPYQASLHHLAIYHIYSDTGIPVYSIMFRTLHKVLDVPDDVLLYIDKIMTGKFYEYLKSEIEQSTGNKFSTMGIFKKRVMFAIMYGEPYKGRYYKEFEKLFPSVYDLYNSLKKDGYKLFPTRLQAFEADIVLNKICYRISRERPELPIFTIHDSVVTIQGHEDYVTKVMIEELTKAVGIPPRLKPEPWG